MTQQNFAHQIYTSNPSTRLGDNPSPNKTRQGFYWVILGSSTQQTGSKKPNKPNKTFDGFLLGFVRRTLDAR